MFSGLLLNKIFNYVSKIWFLWGLCLILNIITFFFIYYKITPGKETLALHYNILVGVEWYGEGYNLYFIPAIGSVILLANFVLHQALKKFGGFLPSLAIFASISIQLVLLLSVLLLEKVN